MALPKDGPKPFAKKELTDTERKLWTYLRGNRLEGLHFRRQYHLGPYVADFFCYAARLVVEVDGPVHENRRARDLARDEWMDANGYNILRFDNGRVWSQLPEVLAEIAQAARLCKNREA
jgi:very-short-patch-repair endonuclease